MKILFIEDKTEAIQGIVDFIEEKNEWEYKNCTFGDAAGNLTMYDPDLVVMDWMYEKGILLDKQEFVPDRVFVEQDTSIENYQTDADYSFFCNSINYIGCCDSYC